MRRFQGVILSFAWQLVSPVLLMACTGTRASDCSLGRAHLRHIDTIPQGFLIAAARLDGPERAIAFDPMSAGLLEFGGKGRPGSQLRRIPRLGGGVIAARISSDGAAELVRRDPLAIQVLRFPSDSGNSFEVGGDSIIGVPAVALPVGNDWLLITGTENSSSATYPRVRFFRISGATHHATYLRSVDADTSMRGVAIAAAANGNRVVLVWKHHPQFLHLFDMQDSIAASIPVQLRVPTSAFRGIVEVSATSVAFVGSGFMLSLADARTASIWTVGLIGTARDSLRSTTVLPGLSVLDYQDKPPRLLMLHAGVRSELVDYRWERCR